MDLRIGRREELQVLSSRILKELPPKPTCAELDEIKLTTTSMKPPEGQCTKHQQKQQWFAAKDVSGSMQRIIIERTRSVSSSWSEVHGSAVRSWRF